MANHNQKNILSFIAWLLHPKHLSRNYNFKISEDFCDQIIKIGSNHLVLPAIYNAIIRKKLENCFPQDFISYLNEISRLNSDRNHAILIQLKFISNLFKKYQIQYVFLKGAALLISKPYDTINERMVGDIDILVSEKDIYRAQKLLNDKGFFKIIHEENHFLKEIISHRHLSRITHPDYIAAIELHRNLLNKKIELLNPKDVLNKRIQTKEGYWTPSSHHMWLHAIFDWQYNDNGIIYNSLSMRTFLDAVNLELKHENFNLKIHPAVTRFYSLCSILLDRYQNRNYMSSLLFRYKLMYPCFRRFSNFFIKSLIYLSTVLNRIKLVIFSKLYRKRLLENPKMIITKTFTYFSK